MSRRLFRKTRRTRCKMRRLMMYLRCRDRHFGDYPSVWRHVTMRHAMRRPWLLRSLLAMWTWGIATCLILRAPKNHTKGEHKTACKTVGCESSFVNADFLQTEGKAGEIKGDECCLCSFH